MNITQPLKTHPKHNKNKTPNRPIIRLKKVCLDFPLSRRDDTQVVKVLKDIDLTIMPKTSVSIVGQSGSGKTSLLMLLSGVERTTSGEIWLGDTNITQQNETALARIRGKNIGVVFQHYSLIDTMSALENVAIALDLIHDNDSEEKAKKWLDLVGLSHRLNHFPSELSGGEQQRVALARAMCTKPDLLLADEPTGNLDAKTSQQVIDLIFELQKTFNTTFVLVTHDEKIAKLCQRQLLIDDGRLSEMSSH